ncbi:MAG: tandem-95 repeat protein, partial [Planctomycetes bacterium]|nr:tandem-95 repeat protein [Planctomycetota bacterium]
RDVRNRVYRITQAELTGGGLITASFLGTTTWGDVSGGSGSTGASAGDVSPDGSEILVKNYQNVFYYRREPGQSIAEALIGVEPIVVPYVVESKGEGVTFDPATGGYFTINEINPRTVYFYDRTLDTVAPTAELILPRDNGPLDADPLEGQLLVGSRVDLQIGLTDLNLDDGSVTAATVSIARDAAPFDAFSISYDAASDVIRLLPDAGTFPDGSYEIVVSGGVDKIADISGNELPSTTFNLLVDSSLPPQPTATGESYQVVEDRLLTIAVNRGVLANDGDGQGDPLTAVLVDEPTNGSLALAADGSFSYDSDENFFGVDTFTYRADNGTFQSDLITVRITVSPRNDLPVAVDDAYEVEAGRTLTTSEAYAGVILDAQPVGYWRLGEAPGSTTAVDVTGAHDGVYQNFAAGDFEQPGAGSGDPDTSVFFDGVDNQVSVPHADELTITGDLTVEFWMYKTAEANDWQRLVGKGSDNVRTFGVWDRPGNDQRILFQQFNDSGGNVVSLTSNSIVGLNQWHHIVATVQGNIARIYIDGRFDALAGRSGVVGSDTQPLTFGKMPDMHTFFPGRLDEVAIYDRALSAAEIDEHFRLVSEQDGPVALSVLANDSDVDGDELTARLVDDVTHGTLRLADDGSFSYTPTEGFTDVDRFTYQAWDGVALSEVVTATIDVVTRPLAGNDQYQLDEDDTLTVEAAEGVLDNDSDAAGGPLSAVLDSDVSNGMLHLESNGSFTYTPNENFFGTDRFTYRASNGELQSNEATVTLTVLPTPDPPLATDDSYTVQMDGFLTTVAIPPPGTNPVKWDENGHYYSIVTGNRNWFAARDHAQTLQFLGAAGHLVTITSAAEADFLRANVLDPAPTSFIYIGLNDDEVEGLFRWVTGEPVTFTDWNPGEPNNAGGEDAVIVVRNSGWRWNDVDEFDLRFAYVVEFDVVLQSSILDNDTDADGDALSAELDDDVQHGMLQLNSNGSFTYRPTEGFVGFDRFTYRARAAGDLSDPATVTIHVNAIPVATGDDYQVDEDTTLSVNAAAGVLFNDSDLGGDELSAVLVDGPLHGTLDLSGDGSFSYTPSENFFGTDTFTYRASDGSLQSQVVSVSIDVVSVNDPPVAIDKTFTTDVNTPVEVTATVPPPQIVGETGFQEPAIGAMSYVAGSGGEAELGFDLEVFVGTVGVQEFGAGNQQFLINDGEIQLRTDLVDVTSFSSLHVSVGVRTWETSGRSNFESGDFIRVFLEVSDNGQTFNITPGTLTGGNNDQLKPLDNGGFGAFTTYEVDIPVNFRFVRVGIDAKNNSSSERFMFDNILIEGTPRNANSGLLADDHDADGDVLTAVLVDSPHSGTLDLNADGTFLYTPLENFIGVDRFTYRADDGQDLSNLATVTLEVGSLAEATTAVDDEYTATSGRTLTVAALGVLDNDLDPQGDPLTALLVEAPQHGDLMLEDDGAFTYTPEAGFVGTDTFAYRASDGASLSNLAHVAIEVEDESRLTADLTGDGFVDFQDLTLQLANWDRDVSAALGNLVDPLTTPINFQDLTLLLAAWTGPGPGAAAAPQAVAVEPDESSGLSRSTRTSESRAATSLHFERLGRRQPATPRRANRASRLPSHDTPLRRLQAVAVDRAMDEPLESTSPRIASALFRRRLK